MMILLQDEPMKCHVCGRGQLPTDGKLEGGWTMATFGWVAYQWTCRHEVTFICPDCKGPREPALSCSQCGNGEAYC
jgi:hypothetical protein